MNIDTLNRALEPALHRLRQRTGVPLAFGGPVTEAGAVQLERFAGHTMGALAGVAVSLGHGLGGKVAALRRPVAVDDYCATSTITHRYDQIIRAEGLRTMVANPVIVGDRVVAVIYGAFRGVEAVGGRVQDAIVSTARLLEQEVAVQDAIGEALTDKDIAEQRDVAGMLEQVRGASAELRALASEVEDPSLRTALLRITDQLAQGGPPAGSATLTSRERDVLALAGIGMSNRAIAARLGLTVQTVKSYMKSAMGKLSAASRLEAVVLARRARLIA